MLAVYDDAIESAARNDRERRLIGIAPWYLDRTMVKGNVLRWLGSGEVCTDHLSLICRPEDREQVAAAVAETLTTTLRRLGSARSERGRCRRLCDDRSSRLA